MPPTLSLVEKALRVATVAHATQTRKTDNSPYIVHPMMCALMLARQGFSETVVSASLVHDVLEDTPYTREKLREELGEEVVRIVEGVSEDKALPWRERKEHYAQAVARGDEAVLAVSVADKIHNIESMLRGYAQEGEVFFSYFTRGKEEQLWFFETMDAVYREYLTHPLAERFHLLCERFSSLVRASE